MGARWDIRRIGFALLGVVFALWWKGGTFASMPTITNAGLNQIQVGSNPSDQTRFELRSPAEFTGAVVDFKYGSFGFGGSFLKVMGGRGMLVYTNSDSYAAAAARSRKTGQCLASCLGNGATCLILVPRDEEALRQMKKVRLHAGSHFRLSGQHLGFQSATLKGKRLDANFGNTGFFLVSAISVAR